MTEHDLANRLGDIGDKVLRRRLPTGRHPQLAARILNKQVRLGRPQAFPGLAAANAGPDYATAIGLLMAGATMPPEVINPDLALPRTGEPKNWWERLTGRFLG